MIREKIKTKDRAGVSVLEYVIVIIVVVLALVAMRPYLKNAIIGQYRKAGEGFGFMRQYDPKNTLACIQDESGFWYSRRCFENKMAKCPINVPGISGGECFNDIKRQCRAACAGISVK
jgi:hypothetical protein